MERTCYLSLFLITLLSFIIISGCGGGNDGITQPSSITTPTVNPSDYGYLVIQVNGLNPIPLPINVLFLPVIKKMNLSHLCPREQIML